jgi:hypothetical protein
MWIEPKKYDVAALPINLPDRWRGCCLARGGRRHEQEKREERACGHGLHAPCEMSGFHGWTPDLVKRRG